jgi:hypothetical protein
VVVVIVVPLEAPTVVVVTRMVVMVVVDTFHSPSGFYGIPGVAVGSKMTLDHRCCGRDPTPMSLLLRRRRVRAVSGWCSSPSML